MHFVRMALLLGLVVFGMCRSSWAATDSLEALASALATPATQRQALEGMRAQLDPAFKDLLQALKEGALYRWEGKIFILNDAGTLLHLDTTPLLDNAGKPLLPATGLEQVPLEESHIALVQRALDAFDLVAADPAKRKSLALRWGNFHDVSLLPLLEKALEHETDAGVKRTLGEAVYKLRLIAPAPEIRRQAATFFGESRAESALGRLRELQVTETVPDVREAMVSAVHNIETYLQRRSLLGYIFNGLSLTSILLIMSLGLAITFGLMGIINMAHGEMLMLGAYTTYVIQEVFTAHLPGYQGLYFVAALPLSFVVVGAFGMVLERGILRFLYGRPLESLLVTWGIGMILQQGARLYFGDQTSVSPPTWFRGGWECLPGLILPTSRLFIIALSLACLAGVYTLLYRTDTGLKLRAVMQNRDMASCMGISSRQVDALTFALGAALAGLAGCALSLIGTVDPEVGKTYIVDAFMVVVLGGVGKLFGTVLASLGIGMSNKLLEPAIGGTAAAVYAKVAILGIVILFLQRKPTGLFPAKERIATDAVR